MIDLLPSGQPPPADVDSASPALLRRRALATVLDVLVSYFVLTTAGLAVIIGVLPAETEGRGGLLFLGSFVLLVPLYLTYCFALEWRYGQTIGKVSQGLVVVSPTGNRPGMLACAVRNLLRYVDFLPVGYLLGWYLARTSPTGQRLGDRFGNTIVAAVQPMDEIEADATEPRAGE